MNKSIKVSQLTIDSMKKMGMKAAIEKANSGSGDSEFVEAAKRFYGNRIKPKSMGKSTGEPAVVGDTAGYVKQYSNPKNAPKGMA